MSQVIVVPAAMSTYVSFPRRTSDRPTCSGTSPQLTRVTLKTTVSPTRAVNGLTLFSTYMHGATTVVQTSACRSKSAEP